MLGRNPGWVTTQGEILADLFTAANYDVRITSTIPARGRRLFDTLQSLVRWRDEVDVVVHSVFSGAAFGITDAASLVAAQLGLPQIFVLRGGNLPAFAQRRPRWVRRVFARAAEIVTPSHFLAYTFAELGVSMRVIPNVIHLDNYPFRLRRGAAPRLLWMRTFHDVYHPELAVEALAALLPLQPDATLTMAGQDKGLLTAVETLAAELGVAERVRFAGFLDVAGKQREFAAHDIFLNTNRIDNMPVSVVEAAAFGLPVVATAVGGIPYLLTQGETGLLVDVEDADGMAAAVDHLLRDPALAERLSRSGRGLAEQSAWSTVRFQWEQLFDEVLHHD